MNRNPSVALFLLIIFVHLKSNSALTCYECTQPKGAGLPCEVNVAAVPQTQCATGSSCIKYIWTTTGSSVIHRHCTPLTCAHLQQNSSEFRTLESCKLCDTDLCNNASFNKTYLALIVALYLLFNVI